MGRRRTVYGESDNFSPATKQAIKDRAEKRVHETPLPALAELLTPADNMHRDLVELLTRGDGWMRWTSDLEGKTLFLKYKFTSQQHPNHYVFVSGPVHDVTKLVAYLVRKCQLVDAGQYRPTEDKPYNHM